MVYTYKEHHAAKTTQTVKVKFTICSDKLVNLGNVRNKIDTIEEGLPDLIEQCLYDEYNNTPNIKYKDVVSDITFADILKDTTCSNCDEREDCGEDYGDDCSKYGILLIPNKEYEYEIDIDFLVSLTAEVEIEPASYSESDHSGDTSGGMEIVDCYGQIDYVHDSKLYKLLSKLDVIGKYIVENSIYTNVEIVEPKFIDLEY